MKKKITKPTMRSRLIRYAYYVEGYSLREIGKLFKVSGETIRRWLNEREEEEENKN